MFPLFAERETTWATSGTERSGGGVAGLVALLLPHAAQAQFNFIQGTPSGTSASTYVRSGNDAWPSGSILSGSTVVVASNLTSGQVRNVVPNPAVNLNDPLDTSATLVRTANGYSFYVRYKVGLQGGSDVWRYRHSDGTRARVDQDAVASQELFTTVAVNALGAGNEGVYAWSSKPALGVWKTMIRDYSNSGGNEINLTSFAGVNFLYPTCHTWGCASMVVGGGLAISKLGSTASVSNGELYPFMGRDVVGYHRWVSGVPHVYIRSLSGSTSPPTIGAETAVPIPLDDNGVTPWCQGGHRNIVLGETPDAAANGWTSDLVAFLGEACKDPDTGAHNRSRLYLYSVSSGNMWELPDDMSLINTTESDPPQYRFDSGYVSSGTHVITDPVLYVVVDNSGDDDVKAYTFPSSF